MANGSHYDTNGIEDHDGTFGNNGISKEQAFDTLDDLDDYRPSKYSKRRMPYLDDLDDEDATMSSLDKYRPSAYEYGPPKDSSDINDIRDYYSGLLTKNRALNRLGSSFRGHQQPYEQPVQEGLPYRGHDLEDDPYFDHHQPPRPHMPQPPLDLDESSRYILDKAKAARSRPMWEPEAGLFERPPPPQQPQGYQYNDRNPEDSMMSSKTRTLLSKLKESTAQLKEFSAVEDFDLDLEQPREQPQPRKTRKPSRFLKSRAYEDEPQEPQHNYNVSRMADEILGESLYPAMEPPRQSASAVRKSSYPTRKYSYQSSTDADRYSDRSSPEARQPLRSLKPKEDDDELDSMINDLKMRTRGRDMSKIISDIEGPDSGSRIYGRKSVSPIPRSRDYYEAAEAPALMTSSRRASSRSHFDPYDYMKNGSSSTMYDQRPPQQPQRYGQDYDQRPQRYDQDYDLRPPQQPQRYGQDYDQRPQRYGMRPQYGGQYGQSSDVPFGYMQQPQRGYGPPPMQMQAYQGYYNQQGPHRGYYE